MSVEALNRLRNWLPKVNNQSLLYLLQTLGVTRIVEANEINDLKDAIIYVADNSVGAINPQDYDLSEFQNNDLPFTSFEFSMVALPNIPDPSKIYILGNGSWNYYLNGVWRTLTPVPKQSLCAVSNLQTQNDTTTFALVESLTIAGITSDYKVIDLKSKFERIAPLGTETGHMLAEIRVSNGVDAEVLLASIRTAGTSVANINLKLERLVRYEQTLTHHNLRTIDPTNNSAVAETAVASLNTNIQLNITDTLVFSIYIRRDSSGTANMGHVVTSIKID